MFSDGSKMEQWQDNAKLICSTCVNVMLLITKVNGIVQGDVLIVRPKALVQGTLFP